MANAFEKQQTSYQCNKLYNFRNNGHNKKTTKYNLYKKDIKERKEIAWKTPYKIIKVRMNF